MLHKSPPRPWFSSEDGAKKIAQAVAQKTGRRVTVRDGKLALIVTIPAASIH